MDYYHASADANAIVSDLPNDDDLPPIPPLRDGGMSLAAAAAGITTSVRSVTTIHITRGSRRTLQPDESRRDYFQPSRADEAEIYEHPTPSKDFSQILFHNDPPRFFGYQSNFREIDCSIVYEPIERIADMEMKDVYISNLGDDVIVNDYMTPEIIEEVRYTVQTVLNNT